MWILVLLAVSVNDPNDVPGRVKLKFDTEQQCVKARDSMEYWLKFSTFKVTAECKRS
jgi:hypothetical protein